MYTSRVVKFKLKNPSLIQSNYTNKIARADTGVKDSGYFNVTPNQGSIPPGGEEEITVRFAPREVGTIMNDFLSSRSITLTQAPLL